MAVGQLWCVGAVCFSLGVAQGYVDYGRWPIVGERRWVWVLTFAGPFLMKLWWVVAAASGVLTRAAARTTGFVSGVVNWYLSQNPLVFSLFIKFHRNL